MFTMLLCVILNFDLFIMVMNDLYGSENIIRCQNNLFVVNELQIFNYNYDRSFGPVNLDINVEIIIATNKFTNNEKKRTNLMHSKDSFLFSMETLNLFHSEFSFILFAGR